MNQPNKYTKDLILRFLNKEATDGEIDELMHWLRQDKENRQYFDHANETYQASAILGQFNPEKIDSAWNNLSAKINGAKMVRFKKTTISRGYYNFLRIAASVSLIAAASFALWKYATQSKHDAGTTVIVYNSAGYNTQMVLPDSTQVWLNTNSTIEYTNDFNTRREVLLKGEAFFDVTKKKHQDFVVKTEQLSIVVKGTRFNVRDYGGEDANTTLEEGKVELRIPGQEQTFSMQPGDQITVAKKEQKITLRKVNPSNYSAWKEDTLVFDNTALADIILKLENKYKIKIEIDPVIAQRERLTMTISDESIDEIMEMIQLSSRLHFKKEKNHFLIYDNEKQINN